MQTSDYSHFNVSMRIVLTYCRWRASNHEPRSERVLERPCRPQCPSLTDPILFRVVNRMIWGVRLDKFLTCVKRRAIFELAGQMAGAVLNHSSAGRRADSSVPSLSLRFQRVCTRSLPWAGWDSSRRGAIIVKEANASRSRVWCRACSQAAYRALAGRRESWKTPLSVARCSGLPGPLS